MVEALGLTLVSLITFSPSSSLATYSTFAPLTAEETVQLERMLSFASLAIHASADATEHAI